MKAVVEVLHPSEMDMADRLAAETGIATSRLMERAGEAVAQEALRHFPACGRIDVLCGPGNNGGDGYVAARILMESGVAVALWQSGPACRGRDAAEAVSRWGGGVRPLAEFRPDPSALVVDALYGAGLKRELAGEDLAAIRRVAEARCPVLAVDLPSGLSGATGQVLGDALRADRTVTFFRKKLGHLLFPGRDLCGQLVVADIGIPAGVLDEIGPQLWENRPGLWLKALPRPSTTAHKYERGHVAVLSGGLTSSGAARLSAEAAARAGAGAVTLLSPPDALLANAAHLTAIMLRRADDVAAVREHIMDRKVAAAVCGPGFGVDERHGEIVRALLELPQTALVLDADAITLLAKNPAALSERSDTVGRPLVLTPHEGEFRRLFPDLAEDTSLSKVERARVAARRARGVVVYKGADTVIAAPDGRAAINTNGSVWLATAGSGDVLAGLTAALLAHRVPAFEAACAAVWVHAEAGTEQGFGVTAEDLPQAARRVLARLIS